jgi:AcrR family transcriptional regulator
MRMFWRKGYEGTSLADLTRSMGINRPSLYAAFGNKEALFRKVLDRYAAEVGTTFTAALDEPTARGAVERLLREAADALTDPGHPPGCLNVQGALACGTEAEPVRKELILRRSKVQRELSERLKRAKREKDLPADVNTDALASYVYTIIHGMAVQATAGASRAELQQVARLAIRVWPS